MTAASRDNIAVALSHEIDAIADEMNKADVTPHDRDDVHSRLLGDLDLGSAFDPQVTSDVDALLATREDHRLSATGREAMLRGATAAIASIRGKLAGPEALETLQQTLLEIYNDEDEFSVLNIDSRTDLTIEDARDRVRRVAAEELSDTLDALTAGQQVTMQPAEEYLVFLTQLVTDTGVEPQVASLGIQEALSAGRVGTEERELLAARGASRFRSKSRGREWADFLETLGELVSSYQFDQRSSDGPV